VKPFEMPFGGQTHVGPRNHVLDGGVYWHHLTNTMDRSVAAMIKLVATTTVADCVK